MLGGIDKRCLSRGTREVWEEVTGKVPRLVEQGGYIPHVDHAVPPDAVLANYVYCRQLIAAIAEGRHLPAP
jgi:uroporphyrinogen decarboxylase